SALAREHGVSRSTVRRRLEKGWNPARPSSSVKTPSLAQPPDRLVARERPGSASMWPGVAAVLVIIAIGIAALAIIINGQAGGALADRCLRPSRSRAWPW